MDPELLELIARMNDETGSAVPLTAEELHHLRDALVEEMRGVDREHPLPADVVMLKGNKTIIAEVDGRIEVLDAAEAELISEANALLEGIEPEVAETETPEVEAVDLGEPELEAEVEDAELVTAAGAPARTQPRMPSIEELARRRPARAKPVPTQTDNSLRGPVLTAAADIPNLAAGMPVSWGQFAEGAMRRYDAVRKVENGGADGEKIYFGKVEIEYPADRFLDLDERLNQSKIDGATGPAALAASGGICGPVAVDYGITTLAVADRPVKTGAFAQFGASRGGLRYILPHTLAMVTADGPAGVWTQATDASPGGSSKVNAVFVCQAVQENYVDAVTSIVQFGNFQARYFPEQIQQYMDTVDAVHSRLAEGTLLAALTTGSTQVTAGNYELGATREFFTELGRAIAAYRYRHRTNAPLRCVIPAWLVDMFREDLTKELPGDSGSGIERLATTDAQINNFFAVRNVNLTTALDSPTGASVLQGFLPQGAGQLVPWPLHTYIWLYHEGAWMFLDGGELNLGMVRDSTLNAKNNFQMFTETFEKAIFRGHESLMIDLKIDPTGASVGTVAPSTTTGLTDQTLGS